MFRPSIPLELLYDKDLTAEDIRVYACLDSHADRLGNCYPGIRTLMTESNTSSPTVQQSIKRLEAKGWIKTTKRLIERLPTIYHLPQHIGVGVSPANTRVSPADTEVNKGLGGEAGKAHRGHTKGEVNPKDRKAIETFFEAKKRKVADIKRKLRMIEEKAMDEFTKLHPGLSPTMLQAIDKNQDLKAFRERQVTLKAQLEQIDRENPPKTH